MKKTFDFLESNKVDYEFVDYKKTHPSLLLLEKFDLRVGFEELINKKGSTYRKLTEEEKLKLSRRDSALEILQGKSSMIKRPIIEFADGELSLGFDPEKITNKTKKNKYKLA